MPKTTKYNKYLATFGMALALVLVGASAPVHAVESGGLGGRPANPDPSNPRTESIFLFTVDPGQGGENAVKVYNNSGTRKTIDIYPVDSQISSGGAFACAQKVEERRAVGSWLKLSKESVTLDSGTTEIVPFTLSVPNGTAAGEHNGCIAIQESNQTPQSAGNGIALSFRSAIRVAVTVKGDIKKELTFTRLQSSSGKDDKILINTALRNNGNVSLDTDIDVRIKSVLGFTVRETGGEFPVLAGGESEFNFETTEPFWGGIYFLTAKASYNPDPKAGLGAKDKPASVTTREILLTAPKPLAAVIELTALIALVGGGTWLWRRRRQGKRWHTIGKFYVVKEGENLHQIAEKFNLPWKTIARINKLKAPYVVTAGDKLRLLPKALEQKSKRTKKPKK